MCSMDGVGKWKGMCSRLTVTPLLHSSYMQPGLGGGGGGFGGRLIQRAMGGLGSMFGLGGGGGGMLDDDWTAAFDKDLEKEEDEDEVRACINLYVIDGWELKRDQPTHFGTSY